VSFEGLGIPPPSIREPFGNVPPPNCLWARAYQHYNEDHNRLQGTGWEMVDEVPREYVTQRLEAIRDVIPLLKSYFH
jgi:hypothetical protein